MKKLLLALLLGLLLVIGLVTAASADNGPHGGFTATTDACAGCHRAHSARSGSNDLLRVPVTDLCLSCHNEGMGASTDVDNGVYTTNANTGTNGEGTVGAGLFGGGFTNAVMTTAWNGSTGGGTQAANAGSRLSTSTHTLGATQTVWGSGPISATVSVASDTMDMECTSCHDPHGKAGYTNATTQTTSCNQVLATSTPLTEACTVKVASYRLLRWQPQGSNGFTSPGSVNWSGGAFPSNGTDTGWTVPDNYSVNGGEWYTLGTTSRFAPNDYLPGGSTNNIYNLSAAMTGGAARDYRPAAINAGFFCAQCHDRYFNNSQLRNNADSATSGYCKLAADGVTTVANPTYTTNPADVAGASATNPLLFPVIQLHPDPAKQTACIANVSYSTSTATTSARWSDTRPSGDAVFMYRHSSGDVRVSADTAVTQSATAFTSIGRTCLSCHVSHGTAAVADVNPNDGVDAASIVDLATIQSLNIGGSLHGGSVLLRMDGRTLCIRCHASGVNFTTIP